MLGPKACTSGVRWSATRCLMGRVCMVPERKMGTHQLVALNGTSPATTQGTTQGTKNALNGNKPRTSKLQPHLLGVCP